MPENDATYSFADDLTWVIGRLQRSSLEGGFWSLVFGGEDAPYGGRVVLGNPDSLSELTDGTVVRVEGRPMPDQIGISMAGTHYEVTCAREEPNT